MIRLKIKEFAAARKLSQRKIFMLSGIDINTVRECMKNPYKNIELVTLDKFAKVFKVDASELIESVPDPDQE